MDEYWFLPKKFHRITQQNKNTNMATVNNSKKSFFLLKHKVIQSTDLNCY